MTKLIAFVLSSAFLTACQTATGPYFHQMSPAELAAHNVGKPIEAQIICITRSTTSSRIRKRRCNTREHFANENARAADMVNAVSAGGPIFRVM